MQRCIYPRYVVRQLAGCYNLWHCWQCCCECCSCQVSWTSNSRDLLGPAYANYANADWKVATWKEATSQGIAIFKLGPNTSWTLWLRCMVWICVQCTSMLLKWGHQFLALSRGFWRACGSFWFGRALLRCGGRAAADFVEGAHPMGLIELSQSQTMPCFVKESPHWDAGRSVTQRSSDQMLLIARNHSCVLRMMSCRQWDS